MDTKLKKSKPFLVWLCFFFGLNIVVFLLIAGLIVTNVGYFTFEDIKASFNSDFKDSRMFKGIVIGEFESLAGTLTSDYNNYIDGVEKNRFYYAKNIKTGETITNVKNEFTVSENGPSSLPDGYDYYFYFNGSRFVCQKDGKPLDIYGDDSGYYKQGLSQFLYGKASDNYKGLENCRILLVVKKDLTDYPTEYSRLYWDMQALYRGKWFTIAFAAVFLFGVIILTLSIFKRNTKREFDHKLAYFTGWFWFEVKAIASMLVLALFASIPGMSYGNSTYGVIGPLFIVAFCFWWFYLMLVDLIINKKKFFSHNSINSVIKRYRVYEVKKPFQKGMMTRVYTLILAEAVLIFFTLIFAVISLRGDGFSIFMCMVFVAVGVYLLYRYMKRYGNQVNDIGLIMEQVERIRKGDIKEVHNIKPDADLYPLQENLNAIQDGLGRAIDEKIRSERMKAELVTNVSHDLKTPLTSIISYVDLLSREEDLPPHIRDYVMILSQKSERLKTLIQDLFDLSKVNSGNVVIDKEKIDLGRVIKQTLADMNEEITQSGLAFRIKIPDEPIFIMSDGSRLYRVFQNLLTNTLKYSLDGSRVYVDVEIELGKAVVIIRNTANYEMNFREDEITERFVRGDEARSTEGTGLGLAIAQSFANACGGTLRIKIDGDLFKVILNFDIC